MVFVPRFLFALSFELSAVSSRGVLLDCMCRPSRFRADDPVSQSQSTWSNVKISMVNHLLHEKRHQDPSATRADAASKIGSMSAKECARLKVHLQQSSSSGGVSGAHCDGGVGAVSEAERGRCFITVPFRRRMPCFGLECLKESVRRDICVAAHGQKIRASQKLCPYSIDAGASMPGKVFHHRYTCSERQPGLCFQM